MHSMIEATSSSHIHDEPMVNGYADPWSSKALTKSDIAIVLAGMLLPLVTQVGHVH